MEDCVHHWAVIPAAGIGARMDLDVPKQYYPINGKAILEYTLERFCNHSKIDGVVVVIADNDRHWSTLSISQLISRSPPASPLDRVAPIHP